MRTVPLSRGQFAIVDDEDYGLVSRFRWCAKPAAKSGFYAIRSVVRDGVKTTEYMHRLIIAAPVEIHVDHINHNGLDNRRSCNLRLCTMSLNLANSRWEVGKWGFRGVSFNVRKCRYRGKIKVNYRDLHLGWFRTAEEAARAYDAAARQHFGEFATFNFSESQP